LSNINVVTQRRENVLNFISSQKVISKHDYDKFLNLLLPYVPNNLIKSDVSMKEAYVDIQKNGELKYFRVLLLSKKKDIIACMNAHCNNQLLNSLEEIPEILAITGEISKFLIKNSDIEKRLEDFFNFLGSFKQELSDIFEGYTGSENNLSKNEKKSLYKTFIEVDIEIFLLKCMYAGVIDYSSCEDSKELQDIYQSRCDEICEMQDRLEGLTHGEYKNLGYCEDVRVAYHWKNLPITKAKFDLKYFEEKKNRAISAEMNNQSIDLIKSYSLNEGDKDGKNMAFKVLIDRYNSYIKNGNFKGRQKFHQESEVVNDIVNRLINKGDNLYESLHVACYLYMYSDV
ncbi:MAG: hypothetical protein GY828_03625, partial [Candidatus Gracilibacteria bacterium]|nr:hypothetical protein [Candidatus Gracilibacteria bacterium]